jgi:hypothetical protein
MGTATDQTAVPLRKPPLRVPIPFPSAYECIVRDRTNRNSQKLVLCDPHFEEARKRALVVLTGSISPATCCDECGREQAEAVATAPQPQIWGGH